MGDGWILEGAGIGNGIEVFGDGGIKSLTGPSEGIIIWAAGELGSNV